MNLVAMLIVIHFRFDITRGNGYQPFSLKVDSFSMVDSGTLEQAVNVSASMKIVIKVTSCTILGCIWHTYLLSKKMYFKAKYRSIII